MANPRRPGQAPKNERERILQLLVRTAAIRTLSASATIDDAEGTVLVDATAGAVTVTLPAAAAMEDRQVVVKKIDSSANAVTIAAATGETVDGASTQAITTQYEALTLHSNGSAWHIVGSWVPRSYGSFTPGISFGGGTTGIVYSLQVGRYIKHGRKVTAMFVVALSNKGSSTGALKFTGLPFATNSESSTFSAIAMRCSGMTGVSDHMQGMTDVNATTVTVEQFVAGVNSAITDAHVTNASSWVVTVEYETTA